MRKSKLLQQIETELFEKRFFDTTFIKEGVVGLFFSPEEFDVKTEFDGCLDILLLHVFNSKKEKVFTFRYNVSYRKTDNKVDTELIKEFTANLIRKLLIVKINDASYNTILRIFEALKCIRKCKK